MVLDPTAVPPVAQEPDIVEKINRIGKQSWNDGNLINSPSRAITLQVTVPLGGEVDLNAMWESAVAPLVAAGIGIQETARADFTEIPEGLRVTGKCETEYRFEKIEPAE